MKNILYINAKNSYLCEVVSNINDGTNRIVLEIECDTSLNPYLVVGSTSIELSSEVSYYVVQQSDLTLGGTFTFYIRDDEHTSDTFTFNVPQKIGSNMSLRRISNFEYTVCSASSSETTLEEIMKAVYPVGSIYMSVSSENPSNRFGGTWVAWGSGKVPVGVNTSDSDFNSVEKTGGSKTVSLTESNLPSHKHSVNAVNISSSGAHTHSTTAKTLTNALRISDATMGWAPNQRSGGGNSATTSIKATNARSFYIDIPALSISSSGAHTHSVPSHNTNNTGSGKDFTNVQPYITCYMWKRIA